MAEYDKRQFYWLQIKDDFFNEGAIEWLEEQPNGEKYSLFYLKLCLKSIRTDGLLIRKVGNILIPYDVKKLCEVTKMEIDTVRVAMELLKQVGLVQILENGAIYLTQVENMVGTKSLGAFKKQQQRQISNQCGQLGDKRPPEIEIEQEIEQDKEKEDENNIVTVVVDFYEQNIGTISPTILSDINYYLKQGIEPALIILCIKKSVDNNKRNWSYAKGILKNLQANGVNTVKQYESEEVSKNGTTSIYSCRDKPTRKLSGVTYL